MYRPTPRQTDLRVGTVVVLDILSQPTNFGFKRASVRPIQWLKWFCEAWGGSSDEARLEQTPYTHSNPTNLALFGHKITVYRFNQGAHTIAGAQIGAGG